MRSEPGSLRRAGPVLVLLAVVFLGVHLAQLPKTLEDSDSINFALGVRDFDVARYQPHPPGFPIYIALARVSTWALRSAGVADSAPRGLAIWGALGGALAAFPLFAFFRRLEGHDRRAVVATVVTMAAPLFWFTANRPLTDMTGLVVTLAAQALAVMAWVRQRDASIDRRAVRRTVLAAAIVAGLAIGVRAQAFTLTLPLLALVVADPRVPVARRAPLWAMAALTCGVLAWGLPLLVASGGLDAYLAAVSRQGAEDFSDSVMLWTHPAPRYVAHALWDTFVLPWATVPLAVVILTLAAAGAAVLARRARGALLLIAASTLPYVMFDLLFQETVHGKYALAVVPAAAYLAIVAIDVLSAAVAGAAGTLGRVASPIAAASVVAASLWSAAPALQQYAAAPSPVFQAFADMTTRAATTGARPVVATHWNARRAAEWAGADLPGPLLPAERYHEWLAAVNYWLGGGRDPVWFLARPSRTDLALIDPSHRVLAGRYRWLFDTRVFTGGARPDGVDWYAFASPGWFLDRGWALTPEVAGVSHADGLGPGVRPSVGYLARRPDETLLMIGGRHLGAATDPPVHIAATIDGRTILEWDQGPGFFLRFQPLPAGTLAGDGAFARLAIGSSNSGPPVPVGLEQFDLQPAGAVVWGFDAGWMELEYDAATERLFRWAGARSTLNIHAAGRGVTIRFAGESPLKYFDAPPHVTVTAGTRTLATFSPNRDFVEEVTVPADALVAGQGRVVIETDRTFSPANGDPRKLGLRMFQVTVK